ncbi:hypothetical protein ACLOAV_004517 [Pseudogymnoascus australis]
MPSLETPVFTINANKIHRIDTRNDKDLFSIWTLFSRCSGSIEQGRRLENLTWRLWNRETFCCAPGEANATTPAISISQRSSECRYSADIPDLSGSIDSINEEAIESYTEESASTSASLTVTRPRVRRKDSGCNRSRGKERHITPDDLEKLVITIKEKKDLEPLTMSTHSYLAPLANKITSPQITSPQLSNTASPIISAPEPEKAASPAPSPLQKSPAPPATPPNIPSQHPRTRTEVSASLEYKVDSTEYQAMFALGGSSRSSSLRRPERKKQSFKEEVATRTIEETSGDFSETDDDTNESAFDDDESSDWEDSMEECSVDDKLSFPRVESRCDLTSRRSLITTMLHQNDRAAALQSAASKSTSALQRSRTSTPQEPSDAPSPESDDSAPLTMKSRMRPGQEVPRTGAQLIMITTTNVTPHQAVLSPKTTRRQMRATELTASLRRHLLWERKQKNQTASAVLKRRRMTHDVSNLKQYPDKMHLGTEDNGYHGSWKQYFGQGFEYHSKGCLETVWNAAKTLLENGIFASTLRAGIRFPGVFDISPAQSAERLATEAKAARNDENAIRDAAAGRQGTWTSEPVFEDESNQDEAHKGKAKQSDSQSSVVRSRKHSFSPGDTSSTSLCPIYLPLNTQHRLQVKVQAILEDACYSFGLRVMESVFQKEGWDCPESVELTPTEFQEALYIDSNNVAARVQMHIHGKTCTKYQKKHAQSPALAVLQVSAPKTACSGIYGYGRGLYPDGEKSPIREHNPVIASATGYNHDVNFTASDPKVLTAVYYMTNYATKAQVDRGQLVLAAAV